MVLPRILIFAGAFFSVSRASQELDKRAPLKAFGIEKNKEGFGAEPVAEYDEDIAAFAPLALEGATNASIPELKDRSLELVGRQSCDPGYGYCASFGRCCPDYAKCCAYGYCIEPNNGCCPGGACDPGWNCCGNKCSPPGGDCCSNDRYCEAGNQCIRLGSTGEIVCCTDVQCTAAVVSGTTSYASRTSRTPPPSSIPPPPPPSSEPPAPPPPPSSETPPPPPPSTITPPPETSQVVSVGDYYTTWYWTVTWWYLSFYWSTFHAESTVTYTRIYETTIFTTEATDRAEASSLFASLSNTLTLTPPADAQTSLASLLNVQPSETESVSSFSFDDSFSTEFSNPESSTTSTARSSGLTAAGSGATASASSSVFQPGGGSATRGSIIPWLLIGLTMVSGALMVWL